MQPRPESSLQGWSETGYREEGRCGWEAYEPPWECEYEYWEESAHFKVVSVGVPDQCPFLIHWDLQCLRGCSPKGYVDRGLTVEEDLYFHSLREMRKRPPTTKAEGVRDLDGLEAPPSSAGLQVPVIGILSRPTGEQYIRPSPGSWAPLLYKGDLPGAKASGCEPLRPESSVPQPPGLAASRQGPRSFAHRRDAGGRMQPGAAQELQEAG